MNMLVSREEKLKEKLNEIFGFHEFRGTQEDIIKNVLKGRNTFVLMPTGAGKSLCYQLPAIVNEGTAIVISPLIALMKNQVDQMNAFGINAQFFNSSLSVSTKKKVKEATLAGQVKLLYVAPESLTREENAAFLKETKISFAAIDEAHCISEWGHDFRPEYRRIKSTLEQLGDIPMIALTATATPRVQLDIQKNLSMEDAEVFKSSFNRPNLYYEVRPKVQVDRQLIRFVRERQGESGIIYCYKRKKVDEIAALLQANDIKVAPYHAGMDWRTRMNNQDDFLNEEVEVMVATIAFGMGIDKPDVRYVIHYDTPKSLEGYYQETGRASRDGLKGTCVMFYSLDDIVKMERFNRYKPKTEREITQLLLEEISAYAESSTCRRVQLLHYFGEEYTDSACSEMGMCDNCKQPKEKYDGQKYIELVLETAQATGEGFDIGHLVHVIRGVESRHVMSHGHNELDVFKRGAEESEIFWRSVVRQTLLNELLEKDIETLRVLKISDKGRAYMRNPYAIEFSKDRDYTAEGRYDDEPHASSVASSCDEALFNLLKSLRKQVAKQKKLPPYIIFQDPSLREMATTYPATEQELRQVNGVGMGKVTKFGKPFLELITKYIKENDIVTSTEMVIKSAANKSRIKIFIIQQIDKKVDLEEIAEARNVSCEEIITEIENICYSGTKLNITYYIDQMIEKDKQDDILDYFLNVETDDIDKALDELESDGYTEQEVRLMRIKFMSEYAN